MFLHCLLIFGIFESIQMSIKFNNAQITQHKFMESVRTPEVMDSGTFGLRTTSLNWHYLECCIKGILQ